MNNNIITPNAPVVPPDNLDSQDENLFIERQKEKEDINQIADLLKHSNFDELKSKYSVTQLSRLSFEKRPSAYRNVLDQILIERQTLIIDFIPPELIKTTSGQLKNKILALLAALKAENDANTVLAWLKQIDANLAIPPNFQSAGYQPRAYELWQAIENLKKIVAESTYNIYLGDIERFLKLPNSQYQIFVNESVGLSERMTKEYDKITNNQEPDKFVIEQALNFVRQVGRSPLFINELKEENNFGDITDFIVKIDFVLKIVGSIRSHLSASTSENEIIEATKKYIIQDINF